MIYITVKQSPRYEQMSLEDFLDMKYIPKIYNEPEISNTKTYERDYAPYKFAKYFDIDELIFKLKIFNDNHKELEKCQRNKLYSTFYIPKKSGGLRKIDAPNADLMNALRNLKTIFEDDFKALYHTSAFAYVKHRCTTDAVKRHQKNNSKWYAKYDLTNFFGSTTLEFVLKMISMVYPFSEVIKREDGKRELSKALELAFLDGGLPQGTPISPLITNIMMIPIDFKLSKALRSLNHQRFVYTRYADDFIISSKYDFNVKIVEHLIVNTLSGFDAPFQLKPSKTRYGSTSGKNWNLGVMVNQDNEITVGYKKKKQFQAMLSSYIMDKQNGKNWDLHDVQVMEGYRNYYRSVEGDNIDKIVEHIANKFNAETVNGNNGLNLKMIKADLVA